MLLQLLFHLVLIPIPEVDKKISTGHIMGQHEFDDNGVYFQNFGKIMQSIEMQVMLLTGLIQQ